jgi:hypothetical protein
MTSWAVLEPVDFAPLRDKVREAKTEAEFVKAQQAMIEAMSEGYFRGEARKFFEDVKLSKVTDALRAVSDEIIDSVCGKFNESVPGFTDAFDRIPNMSGEEFSVFSLKPDQLAALSEAKTAAEEMAKVYKVYEQVCRLMGWQSADGVRSTAARIGEFETDQQLSDAAEIMMIYRTRGHGHVTTLAPLAPFVAVPLAGGRLRLEHPVEAEQHREGLVFQSYPATVVDD